MIRFQLRGAKSPPARNTRRLVVESLENRGLLAAADLISMPVAHAQYGQPISMSGEGEITISALIDTKNRQAVVDAFQQRYLPALQPPPNWTGNVTNCVPGTTSQAFTDATLNMINYFREMSGLVPVTFDPALNSKAQQAALMMDAADSLSHSPGPTWPCYTTTGAQAAGSSNLALGASGARAIALYIEDPGAGNTAAGHRRWILYPHSRIMGTGSTTQANALWVFGESVNGPSPDWVPWPPAGYVPRTVVYPRWSLSRDGADFSAATVTMTVGPQTLNVVRHSVQNGFGLNTLVWEPQNLSFPAGAADKTVTVTVSNVIVGGVNRSYTYDVIVIDPNVTQAEIVVELAGANIAHGSAVVDFGTSIIGSGGETRVFNVRNTGGLPLTLGTLVLPSGFSIVEGLSSTIAPGANDTFAVRLDTATLGPKSGQLSFSTNDADENPFNFTISGLVRPTLTPPTISDLLDQATREDTPTGPISFTVADAEYAAADLTVQVSSSNAALVLPANIVLSGTGSNRTLTITPLGDRWGSTTVTVTVADFDGLTASDTFVLTVLPANDPPTFTGARDVRITNATGETVTLAWTTAISPGPPDESEQITVFEIGAPSRPELFVVPPTLAADGTLSFQPVTGVHGASTVSVRLLDDGGTANGGQNVGPWQTLTIKLQLLGIWHNKDRALDVEGPGDSPIDGKVVAGDALAIINYINAFGAGEVPPNAAPGPPYYDTVDGAGLYKGDNQVTPADVLAVINHINAFGPGLPGPVSEFGEGEPMVRLRALSPELVDIVLLLASDFHNPPKRGPRGMCTPL